MACLLVPLTEAIVVSVAKKILVKNTNLSKNSFIKKLNWLTNLLYGGAFLLTIEHIWHGEIVPWFPFLTAMNNPSDTEEMLHEMATVGITMAFFVTFIWICMVLISNKLEKLANMAQKV